MYIWEERKKLSRIISRHKKRDKKYFWHIDYLLTDENVQLEYITIISENSSNECSENKKLLHGNASISVEGFGAADYKNDFRAHLFYIGI